MTFTTLDIDSGTNELVNLITHNLQDVDKRSLWKKYPMRCSAMPLCPRDYYLFHHFPIDRRPQQRSNYRNDIILNQGTVVHSVLQKWLGLSGILLGNWECRNDKCPTFLEWASSYKPDDNVHERPERELVKWKVGTQKCPKCGKDMVYEELSVFDDRVDPPLSGHPDGIVPINLDHPERKFDEVDLEDPNTLWILLEGKTINPKWFKGDDLPFPKHFVQANCYAHLVPKCYGVPRIDLILFLYINRGWPQEIRPLVATPDFTMFENTVATIAEYGPESVGEMESIPRGSCDKNSLDPYCCWNTICTSPVLGKELGKSDDWV